MYNNENGFWVLTCFKNQNIYFENFKCSSWAGRCPSLVYTIQASYVSNVNSIPKLVKSALCKVKCLGLGCLLQMKLSILITGLPIVIKINFTNLLNRVRVLLYLWFSPNDRFALLIPEWRSYFLKKFALEKCTFLEVHYWISKKWQKVTATVISNESISLIKKRGFRDGKFEIRYRYVADLQLQYHMIQ